MKTANIGRIAAEIPQGKKGKFNLSHDNNTTYDWGSVQPIFSKLMLPDSSMNIELEQLKRLAPMVVPTFGRVKTKNIAHFIPMEQIWPNWQAMLSKTKVTRSSVNENGEATSNTYIPKHVPYTKNNVLAAYILTGAKVNLYFSGVVGSQQENTWTCARNNGSWSTQTWPEATIATRKYLAWILDIPENPAPQNKEIPELNYNGPTMEVRRLILNKNNKLIIPNRETTMGTVPSISTMAPQPLQNANGNGYTHSAANEKNSYNLALGDDHITFSEADYIWEYKGSGEGGITSTDREDIDSPLYGITNNFFDSCKIRITFKLSSFGKRLKKVLIGLGYNINLSDETDVSLLPLIAYYKAWWDTYAPERYKNFYETPAWKIIQGCMQTANAANITPFLNSDNAPMTSTFKQFISDLGTCFATEKIDAISAATDNFYGQSNTTDDDLGRSEITNTIIATLRELNKPYTTTDSSQQGVNTVGGSGNRNTSITTTDFNGETKAVQSAIAITAGATAATANLLTQFQIDALKKAYIGINKASVAGMKVEEILRALGFGDYVEECKGRFINGSDDLIKISDVIATAATEEAKLGQYGGRGLGTSTMQISYSAKNHGYFIILSCVVPESGYINAPAHENTAISFEKMFNPDYDGISYEAIQKKALIGSPLINDETANDTFGYLPTYTQWKFMSNKANGDFSNNSMKKTMRPYTLDKYIPVSDIGVYSVEETNGHPGSTTELCTPTFKYEDTPNAGEDWRFINKFPWNGDYNRIFAASDDGIEWSVFSPNNNAFLYLAYEYDNIMIHNVLNVTYWAHMKEIEESYNTYDEEHGAPKSTIARS